VVGLREEIGGHDRLAQDRRALREVVGPGVGEGLEERESNDELPTLPTFWR